MVDLQTEAVLLLLAPAHSEAVGLMLAPRRQSESVPAQPWPWHNVMMLFALRQRTANPPTLTWGRWRSVSPCTPCASKGWCRSTWKRELFTVLSSQKSSRWVM